MEPEMFDDVESMCDALRTKSSINDMLYRYTYVVYSYSAAVLNLIIAFNVIVLSILYLNHTIERSLANIVYTLLLFVVMVVFARSYNKFAIKTLDKEYQSAVDDLIQSHLYRYKKYASLSKEELQEILNDHISKAMNILNRA